MNVYTLYRPIWLVLNLVLISIIFTSWYHMNPKVIKIDLEHINAMTNAYVMDASGTSTDATTAKMATTNMNRKAIGATDMSLGDEKHTFCEWVTANEAHVQEPFKSMKCTDKDSISLHDFAAPGMYNKDNSKNETIWYIYAHGERSNADGGQIFAHGQNFKYASDAMEKKLLEENLGFKYGPDVCSHKYLKWVREVQMTLAIIAILYFLLHVVHLGVYSTSQSEGAKKSAEIALLVMSVVTYVFLIVAYVIEQRSPIFTQCSWITEWFQDDYVMLYRLLLSYLILGIVGIAIVAVHIFVMATGKGDDADYALLNLVGSTKPNALAGFSA